MIRTLAAEGGAFALLIKPFEDEAFLDAVHGALGETTRNGNRVRYGIQFSSCTGVQRLAMKDSEISATSGGISVRALCKTGCNRILERFLWASPERKEHRKLHEGTISGAKLNPYTALTRFAADSSHQDLIVDKRIESAIEPE